MAGRIVVYNEPAWKPFTHQEEIVGETLVLIHEDVAIRQWKAGHPERQYSDEEALNEFMVVNWAKFYEGELPRAD